MAGSYHRGKLGVRYAHYWCKTKGCQFQNKSVQRDKVETEFMGLLRKIAPNKGFVQAVQEIMLEVWKEKQTGELFAKSGISDEVKALESKIAVYMERLGKTSNEILIRQYEQEVDKLVKKKASLEANLGKRRYSDERFGTTSQKVFNCLSDPIKLWESPSYKDKRLVLNMYFEAKLVYDRQVGFGTQDLPLILELLRQEELSKIDLVEMPGVKPGSKTCLLSNCSQA